MRISTLATTSAAVALIALGMLLTLGPSRVQGQENAEDYTVPRTPWGDPDIQGVWDQTTGTPLQRSEEISDREFLTEEEATEREESRFARFDNPDRGPRNPTGDYGSVWREGSKNSLTRTSLIVDPPSGRIPELTAAGKEARAAREMRRTTRGPADSWEDRGLWERCMTRGTPRIPNNYNSNWHILQTPTHVVIHQEMIHENRIIPIDGRAGLGSDILQWNGVSRGHWEGDTLVVEITQFNDKQQVRGGYLLNTARVVERFRRVGPDNLDYEFTIEDDIQFTMPWTVSLPLIKGTTYYEYACHEGNYGMTNILAGHRAQEKEAGGQ